MEPRDISGSQDAVVPANCCRAWSPVTTGREGMCRWLRAAVVAIAVGFVLFASTAQGQQNSASANALGYKDPGTATLFGVLITGGGQFYSGETTKGATLLGIGLGSLIAGVALTGTSCSAYSCSTSAAPLLLGTLGYLGTWAYGWMDAADAARRHNTALGLKTVGATPTIRSFSDGRWGVGLALGSTPY